MSILTTSADEFAAALPNRGRLLSLDVGTKTIGLATASADWAFATARETLRRTKASVDTVALADLIRKEAIVGLVIGLPLSMDGSDTTRTQSVRAQARNWSRELQIPILLWDERWSTVAVERAMIEADVSRAKRAERVDALAAAHILDGALARLAHIVSGA